MKRAALVLFVLLANVSLAEPAVVPAARPRLTEELRRQVEESTGSSKSSAAIVTNDGTVLLPAIRVNASREPRREPVVPVLRQQPFTWVNGGTFLKYEGRNFTLATGLRFNAQHGGFDLLSISW